MSDVATGWKVCVWHIWTQKAGLECRTQSDALQTPPGMPGSATPPAEPAPAATQQATALLDYAWKHVFDIPGLPSALR